MKHILIGLTFFSVLLTGCAASAGRAPAETAEAPAAGAGADRNPLDDFRVEGIISTDDGKPPRALIRDGETGKDGFYVPGNVIRGMQIKEITAGEVIFADLETRERFFLKKIGGGKRSPRGEPKISFDFDNADIRVVLKFVSDLTGTNFIIDQNVRGTVTVMAPDKIPLSEVMSFLESILEVRGFALVSAGNAVKVMQKRDVIRRSVPLVLGPDEPLPADDGVITRMIAIEDADVETIRAVLGPLFSKDATVIAEPSTNTLIITDTASNISRLEDIIDQLDRPSGRIDIRKLIMEYSELSGENIVAGPEVKGTVTFNAPAGVAEDNYPEVLKTIIETAGFVMDRDGLLITVRPASDDEEEEEPET